LDIIPIDSSRGGSNNRVSPSLSKGETTGESETVGLYFNEVLLGIKGRGYQKIPIWFYLCIPPGLFLLSYIIMLFRSGNPRQFFISFLRRDDPVLSLKEQIRELRQDPTLEAFRKFYRFIRIWLSEQYYLESNFNSQQLSAAVSNTLDMTEKSKLLDFLEKLDQCCWSDTPPDKEELFSDFDPEWLYSIPGRKSS